MRKNIFKAICLTTTIVVSAATTTATAQNTFQNKRELVLSVLDQSKPNDYVPAAFFLHFDNKLGAKAVQDHIDFIRATNMDIVKIQYEIVVPHIDITTPEDFKKVPVYQADFFEPQLSVIEDLANEFKEQLLIFPTVYSPLMLLYQTGGQGVIDVIKQDPSAAEVALANLSASLINFIGAARERGADGFYISTQGGSEEAFGGVDGYNKIARPYDKALSEFANEIAPINILHICGYTGNYSNVEGYVDYPASIINPPFYVGEEGAGDFSKLQDVFHRPIFGGLNRLGAINKGTLEEAKAEVDEVFRNAPANFILGANCTVPSDTDYDQIRAIIDYAHNWRKTHSSK